jgi:methyltransferase (TIGR00027 family)
MSERLSSQTAEVVAVMRAIHQLTDGAPKILDDPVVVDLLPASAIEAARADRATFESPPARALRSHVLVRSRWAEDRLAEAFARGVQQYVVLGAGHDTFGFRQPTWASALRIFEVDQPATQADKRSRLAGAGIAAPANVTFAAIDFESTSLEEGLRRAGVDLEQPVFFSWLGVTVYLSAAAVDAVFRAVAALPPSSEIVFTFSQPFTGAADESALTDMADRVARTGEPWITFYETEELIARLRHLGFTRVDLLTPAETEARYFRGRTDGLPVPRRISIAAAVR